MYLEIQITNYDGLVHDLQAYVHRNSRPCILPLSLTT